MGKKYIPIDGPIKDVPEKELIALFDGEVDTVLLRSIILNEKEFIDVDYNRSLRRFWYRTVKPVLSKLGKFTISDQSEEKIKKWDRKLSDCMADLVRMGAITYQDIRIVDESRQRRPSDNIYCSTRIETYGYKAAEPKYPGVILCTEKDTTYNTIRDVAAFFGCSAISGAGQNSLGAMEDFIRNIVNQDGWDGELLFMSLTDFDPSGYNIANTFMNQAGDLQDALNVSYGIRHKRIGIEPIQLTSDQIEKNKYVPKFTGTGKTPQEKEASRRAKMQKWIDDSGGIDGKPYGLELDALEPDDIRGLFIDEIEPYIDPEIYTDFIRRSYLQKLVLETIQGKVQTILDDIESEYLHTVKAKDFDMFDIAREGGYTLPISKLCHTSEQKHIKAKALNHFKQ